MSLGIDDRFAMRSCIVSAWIREGDRHGEKVEFVPARGTATADDRIAVVPPWEQVTGMILVPSDITSPLEALKVQPLGPAAMPMLVAAQIVELSPMLENERRRRSRARQFGVGVRVLGGGVWLAYGAGMDRLDVASITGLSFTFQKGYENGLAFEVEASGGRTGEARFQSVTWDGIAGDVARSALMGRLQAGAAMRLGDRYMTTLRAGIGVQGMNYDSSFTDMDGTRSGPGSSFDIGFAVYMGAAFSARMGENWALGINSTFTEANSLQSRMLEFGLHIRYGWDSSIGR